MVRSRDVVRALLSRRFADLAAHYYRPSALAMTHELRRCTCNNVRVRQSSIIRKEKNIFVRLATQRDDVAHRARVNSNLSNPASSPRRSKQTHDATSSRLRLEKLQTRRGEYFLFASPEGLPKFPEKLPSKGRKQLEHRVNVQDTIEQDTFE